MITYEVRRKMMEALAEQTGVVGMVDTAIGCAGLENSISLTKDYQNMAEEFRREYDPHDVEKTKCLLDSIVYSEEYEFRAFCKYLLAAQNAQTASSVRNTLNQQLIQASLQLDQTPAFRTTNRVRQPVRHIVYGSELKEVDYGEFQLRKPGIEWQGYFSEDLMFFDKDFDLTDLYSSHIRHRGGPILWNDLYWANLGKGDLVENLLKSLHSIAEVPLYRTYLELVREKGEDCPALIPQVWVRYHIGRAPSDDFGQCVDFMGINTDKVFALHVDGRQHEIEPQKSKDARMDEYLASWGINSIRWTASAAMNENYVRAHLPMIFEEHGFDL